MSVFNLPQTLSTTNPWSADYATLRRASAADSTNPADTATKVHWSSNASTHVMFFAELDSNGNVTIDVNTSPTTSQPTYVSKISSTERIHGSITVTNGDTIYLQHSSVHLASFVWNSSYVVASTTNNQGSPGTLSNTGSLEKVGSNLVWTISSASQDGEYYINESSDGGSSWTNKTTLIIPNLAGTRTGNVFSWNESYMYKFYGPLENLLGSYSPGGRKVFCNFW